MPNGAPPIVWENRLDRRFHVKLERIDGGAGGLTVVDAAIGPSPGKDPGRARE